MFSHFSEKNIVEAQVHCKPKIIVVLDSDCKKIFKSIAKEDDFVVLGDGIDVEFFSTEQDLRIERVRSLTSGDEQKISMQLESIISGCNDDFVREMLFAHSNALLSYSVGPLFRLVFTINSLLEQHGIEELAVIAPRRKSKRLPMFGFKTTELKRGSAKLYGGWLASQLVPLFDSRYVRKYYTRRDIFCFELVRQAVLAGVNVLLSANFLLRTYLLSKCKSIKNKRVEGGKKIVLMRASHQMRFAAMLVKASGNNGYPIHILPFPQFSQGSLKSYRDFLEEYDGLSVCLDISLSDILAAVIYAVNGYRKIVTSHVGDINYISFDSYSFKVSLCEVLSEIKLMYSSLVYMGLLKVVLKKYRPELLISFELVGRISGIEAFVAKSLSVKICTVQTALVASRPHVIFPMTDIFYCDSPTTAVYLNDIKTCAERTVTYSGAPYKLGEVANGVAGGVFSCIGFFTQPYEASYSREILSVLLDYANETSAKIKLRLHPRDTIEVYLDLVEQASGVIEIDTSCSALHSLSTVELCVTRTSSVAKEAIALGKPVVLCLFSHYDRSIRADYLSENKECKHRVFTTSELYGILRDSQSLFDSVRILQRMLFLHMDVEDLVKELSSV